MSDDKPKESDAPEPSDEVKKDPAGEKPAASSAAKSDASSAPPKASRDDDDDDDDEFFFLSSVERSAGTCSYESSPKKMTKHELRPLRRAAFAVPSVLTLVPIRTVPPHARH